MRVFVFSSNDYTERMLNTAQEASKHGGELEFEYCESRLNLTTASLAKNHRAVCCFVDDDLSKPVLEILQQCGVELIVLRCTGFNNVDLAAAKELGIIIMRVSEYSPYSVAEFAVGLLLTMVRKIHRAHNRVREGNFLLDGLLGFDLHGKTVGVIGLGKIGSAFAKIMLGFGCRVMAYDIDAKASVGLAGVEPGSLPDIFKESDIISLHLPLTPDSFHMVNAATLAQMKPGCILINTSRGALVNVSDLIQVLKQDRLGGVCLDVYEEESDLFYCDLQDKIIKDDEFVRLRSFPNVLITGHQGFFTEEALGQISSATLQNILDFANGVSNDNLLSVETHTFLTSTEEPPKHYKGTRYLVRESFVDEPDI